MKWSRSLKDLHWDFAIYLASTFNTLKENLLSLWAKEHLWYFIKNHNPLTFYSRKQHRTDTMFKILRWSMIYLGLSTITVWFKLTEVASTFTARLRSRYSMSEYNREEELESCLVDWIIGSWLWSTQITIITNRNQIMVCQGGDLGAGSCSKIVCGDDRWRCSDSTWRVTWIDHFWTITTIKQIINCILLSPKLYIYNIYWRW